VGEETNVRNLVKSKLLLLHVMLHNMASREEGQDLVEYALVVSLVALAAISGVKHVASAVVTVFTNVSDSLA
jgi:pilus assembly protein Flp/PilA